jgi:signal transduction histidine kinase
MAVELMKERADPQRKRELEQDIAELDSLIEEILLASRLDAGTGLEAAETVDLLALAAEEAARFDVQVTGESLTLRGHVRLLRRMVRNLLENAGRHGAPPVTLSLRGRELAVCDAGPGVPVAERERIFEPFYRGARGSGLGLSIVRQIARRHGGEVRCEGNCFVVRLP